MKNENNLCELVFIIDKSGSMSGLEGDTIGGFNSMIKQQKAENGKCLVSTVLFDNYCPMEFWKEGVENDYENRK